MQVQDSNSRLLYGLFQSICGWALENGYRDIAAMKNLLKLAMVDVCRRQHDDKSPLALQMSVVTDLGISLRNAQYSLKALDDWTEPAAGGLQIHQLQREILMVLTQQPHTFDELLREVSFLIHAPYDLQRRTLKTFLKDLVEKDVIAEEVQPGKTVYRTVESHVDLFDPTDLAARLSALLSHIDYFKHTVGKPFFETYDLTQKQARGLQTAVNELLRGSGNAHEFDLREQNIAAKPYYFYLGSAPLEKQAHKWRMDEVILEVVQTRFRDVNSPSLAKAHWYHLTAERAAAIFVEVKDFIQREGSVANRDAERESQPYAFYFGMADRRAGISNQGVQS